MKQRYSLFVIFGISFLLASLLTAMDLLPQNQDLRQQASGCSMDTQFRPYTSQNNGPWVGGTGFSPKVGEEIDVTCFVNNGAGIALGGNLIGSLISGGTTTNFSFNDPEAKRYKITKAGTYSFTCRDASGACTNTDTFTVLSTASPSPSPSATPTPTPQATTGVCTTYKLSDVNKDCRTNLDDYNAFLQDFRQNNAL